LHPYICWKPEQIAMKIKSGWSVPKSIGNMNLYSLRD
jgi:hypothetical protein